MKYSKNFERDYNWYLSVSHIFSFDGSKDYFNKKGIENAFTYMIAMES